MTFVSRKSESLYKDWMNPANMSASQDPFIRLQLEPRSSIQWNACEHLEEDGKTGWNGYTWVAYMLPPLCVAFLSISFHCILSPGQSDKVVDHISSESPRCYVPNMGVVIALGLLMAEGRRTVICYSPIGDMDTTEYCVAFSFPFP